MNKQTRGLLFIFNGYEPEEELIGIISRELAVRCKTEDRMNSFLFNARDLARGVITTLQIVPKEDQTDAPPECTPEEEAVVYVGTTMRDVLGYKYKPEVFMSVLIDKMAQARCTPTEESSKAFMNALFILSQEDLVISKALLKKYNLSEAKIAIIKKVYNILKTFQWERLIEINQQKNVKS